MELSSSLSAATRISYMGLLPLPSKQTKWVRVPLSAPNLCRLTDKPPRYGRSIVGSNPARGTMNHIDLYLAFTDRFSHKHRSGAKKGVSMTRKVIAMINTGM